MEIKFVKTHPDAILPSKNNPHPLTGDTGYDLFAVEDTIIPPYSSAIVPVGIKVGYISPGYWFKIEARSGNGFKKGVIPFPGVIDNLYTGDLSVKCFNHTSTEQIIEKGKGVAQIAIYQLPLSKVSWMNAEDVKETVRGEKGFGSSDKK